MSVPDEQFGKLHELRRERARRFGGAYVEDMVLGANDGIITTFAVVAGAEGGMLGAVALLVLGFANLLADSFSMGASNYLGRRSRSAYLRTEEEALRWEIEHEPEDKREEIERHIRELGVDNQYQRCVVRGLTSGHTTWLRALQTLGGQADNDGASWKHGVFTLIAFIIAGAFPLIPFLVLSQGIAFTASAVTAAVALFVAGALRNLITGFGWLRSGLEMLAVGLLAALVAYGTGYLASIYVGR